MHNKLRKKHYEELINQAESEIDALRNKMNDKIKQKKREIQDLKDKLEILESQQDNLDSSENGFDTSYNGNSLTSHADQYRITQDIVRDLGAEEKLDYSIFSHVDNVRFVYAQANKVCPKWFSDKYGHLFVKNN